MAGIRTLLDITITATTTRVITTTTARVRIQKKKRNYAELPEWSRPPAWVVMTCRSSACSLLKSTGGLHAIVSTADLSACGIAALQHHQKLFSICIHGVTRAYEQQSSCV